MIAHILVATDGSELALKAATLGGELARALNARVTILAVLDDAAVVAAAWGDTWGVAGSLEGDTTTEMIRRQMEETALERALPKAAAAVGELDVGAEFAHTWGRAATEICAYASQHAVDLIVMGSHGRTGVKAVLLGSVSHAVVNRAPCAVTIVH